METCCVTKRHYDIYSRITLISTCTDLFVIIRGFLKPILLPILFFFFLNDPPTPELSPLPLHAPLPISGHDPPPGLRDKTWPVGCHPPRVVPTAFNRGAGRRCAGRFVTRFECQWMFAHGFSLRNPP